MILPNNTQPLHSPSSPRYIGIVQVSVDTTSQPSTKSTLVKAQLLRSRLHTGPSVGDMPKSETSIGRSRKVVQRAGESIFLFLFLFQAKR